MAVVARCGYGWGPASIGDSREREGATPSTQAEEKRREEAYR